MKLLPRCVGTTRDNTQCGRRVSDGSNPPVCHIHRAVAHGTSVSPLTDPVFDPMKDLRQLARSSDDRVKLRAIDLILELARKDEERAARRVANAGGPSAIDIVRAMTDDERAEISLLSARYREIREAVYDRVPTLRPADHRPDRSPEPDPVAPEAEPAPVEEVADTPQVVEKPFVLEEGEIEI